MIVTVNSDCTQIQITSEELQVTNTHVELELIDTAGVSKKTVIPVTTTEITADITEGVYDVILTVYRDNQKIVLKRIVVPLCALRCKGYEFLVNNDLEKFLALEALKAANECPTCDSALLRKLFKKLFEHDPDTCKACACC